MIGLKAVQALSKFGGKSTHDLLSVDVIEIASHFGQQLNPILADDLLNMLKKDDASALSDWILDPVNLEKLQTYAKPNREQTITIGCPNCDELSTYVRSEIPPSNPHVVCRWCAQMIPLTED